MRKNIEDTRIESMWGSRILDEGFTNIPNLIIRNLSRIDMSPAEYVVTSIILTFKHDTKDPFPSQETIARHYFGDKYVEGKSERAIRKHLKSLEDKGLVWVGYKYSSNGKRQSSVYNFQPLIDAVLALELDPLDPVETATVHWKKGKEKNTTGTKSSSSTTLKVTTTGTKSSSSRSPKVPTKKKIEKENLKKKNEKENLSIQEEINNANLPKTVKTCIQRKIDRLIFHTLLISDIEANYDVHKSTLKIGQYKSALEFALNEKNKIKNFDAMMAKNVKKQLEFAAENVKAKKKSDQLKAVDNEADKKIAYLKGNNKEQELQIDENTLENALFIAEHYRNQLTDEQIQLLKNAGEWAE